MWNFNRYVGLMMSLMLAACGADEEASNTPSNTGDESSNTSNGQSDASNGQVLCSALDITPILDFNVTVEITRETLGMIFPNTEEVYEVGSTSDVGFSLTGASTDFRVTWSSVSDGLPTHPFEEGQTVMATWSSSCLPFEVDPSIGNNIRITSADGKLLWEGGNHSCRSSTPMLVQDADRACFVNNLGSGPDCWSTFTPGHMVVETDAGEQRVEVGETLQVQRDGQAYTARLLDGGWWALACVGDPGFTSTGSGWLTLNESTDGM